MHPAAAETTAAPTPQTVDFWLTPTSYWAPKHLPVSAWYSHTPFAAWLMDTLRPSSVVELGTHYGCSCFAFAESAKRLSHPCTILAVDTWEGDDHAGFYGQEVLDYVATVTEAEYPESVRLIRSRFNEARHAVEDESVDLLHIDGRHAYEDVLEDYSHWRSAVRSGGIILFHDIAEQDNGFGVWRLWDEIAGPGRSFAFEHGHGLGVLAVGDVRAPALRALFEADDATAHRIREDFRRLGGDVERRAWLETLPAELASVRDEVQRRSDHEQTLTDTIAQQSDYITELRSSTSWQVTAPLRAIGRLRPDAK